MTAPPTGRPLLDVTTGAPFPNAAPPHPTRADEDRLADLLVDVARLPLTVAPVADALHTVCTEAVDVLDVRAVAIATSLAGGGPDDPGAVLEASDPRLHDACRDQLARHRGAASDAWRTGSVARSATGGVHLLSPEGGSWTALPLRVADTSQPDDGHPDHGHPDDGQPDDGQPAIGVLVVVARPGPRGVAPRRLQRWGLLAQALAARLQTAQLVRHSTSVITSLSRTIEAHAPVEQAKGVLVARLDLTPGDAFALMRAHARRRRVPVAAVARHVLDGGALLPRERSRP